MLNFTWETLTLKFKKTNIVNESAWIYFLQMPSTL